MKRIIAVVVAFFAVSINIALTFAATAIKFAVKAIKTAVLFTVKRFSFVLSLLHAGCAFGMLYGAVASEYPVKGTWVFSCVIMSGFSLLVVKLTWKEEKDG